VSEGEGLGAWLEENVPAAETMSEIHDAFLEAAIPELGDSALAEFTEGYIDSYINIPSMFPAYAAALWKESINSIWDLFKRGSDDDEPDC